MASKFFATWFLLIGLFFAAFGCGKKDQPSDAKPEQPVLSKPVAEVPTAAPAAPKQPSLPPSEVAEQQVDKQAPTEADQDDDDGDVNHAAGKRKRGKSQRTPVRKRSSTQNETADSEEKRASGLRVKRIQFSEQIAGREPVEPEETFSANTTKLFAFVELANDTKEKTQVTVTFVPPLGAATKVTLDVGDKSRWRTWAERRSPKAIGTWKVIVKDLAGHELAHRTFEVTE